MWCTRLATCKCTEILSSRILYHMIPPFNININIIRKQLSAVGRKKSVRPDGIPGEILKLGGKP
jgi:hypothetical protein